jgi:energy-coupling factor transporter ATP-binding protein EcfA2
LIIVSLDMESIDALAKAVNAFEGGLVLVSHDMRLISQVAKEIWICDHKSVAKYHGDILNFKMDMRSQMGIEGEQKGQLRGDASVSKKSADSEKQKPKKADLPVIKEKVKTVTKKVEPKKIVKKVEASKPITQPGGDLWDDEEEDLSKNNTVPAAKTSLSSLSSMKSSLPKSSLSSKPGGKYVPPHLRNRK